MPSGKNEQNSETKQDQVEKQHISKYPKDGILVRTILEYWFGNGTCDLPRDYLEERAVFETLSKRAQETSDFDNSWTQHHISWIAFVVLLALAEPSEEEDLPDNGVERTKLVNVLKKGVFKGFHLQFDEHLNMKNFVFLLLQRHTIVVPRIDFLATSSTSLTSNRSAHLAVNE